MALTASLSSVQTEFSLNNLIWSVIGSEVDSPQIVPEEQLVEDVVMTLVDPGVVGAAVVVGDEASVEHPDRPLHLL